MPLLSAAERSFLESLAGLAYGNPFLPERIESEKAILGKRYVERNVPWNLWHGQASNDPNVVAIRERAEAGAESIRERLRDAPPRGKAGRADLSLYEDLVLYVLYYRYADDLGDLDG